MERCYCGVVRGRSEKGNMGVVMGERKHGSGKISFHGA